MALAKTTSLTEDLRRRLDAGEWQPGDLMPTERALATDEAVARAELNAFRELGVRVAVDDFGTGYSSLAQLRRFPVDVLKLDAAFVRGLGTNPADDAIVATVQGLADALALRTVAEGVETVDQLDALRGDLRWRKQRP